MHASPIALFSLDQYTQPLAWLGPRADRPSCLQGVNEVKFQVIRLMRMLVQICQTLESVPEEVCYMTRTARSSTMSACLSKPS